jgi:RNA polymerase sigma factor (sigma-70 family)
VITNISESIRLMKGNLDPSLFTALQPILERNFERGRVDKFTEGNPERLPDYIERVVDFYTRLNGYLTRVQIDREDAVWEPLYDKLVKWAASFMIRRGLDSRTVIGELAFAQASEAAMLILKATFPYDTEFDPWAYVIVQKTCLKFMRENLKPSRIPAQKLESLDDILDYLAGDSGHEEKLVEKDARAALKDAVDALPGNRGTVISDVYFNDLSFDEIARKLGKTPSAIYCLHFNALQDLRKILKEKGIY